MADAYKMDGTEWRNRIVGYDSVDPETLLANPRNFRAHPKGQQDVLTGTLNEVGWVDDVLVNRVTGHVIDGHLRVQLALRKGMDSIPVKYVELSEAEEALILATFDPIAAMATHDAELLDAVLRDVETGDEHVQAMLTEMAADAGLYTDGGDVEDVEPQTDKAEALREQWGVTTGQLWLLDSGNGHPHRLICGDCTDADVVARLMDGERAGLAWFDPPFGIDLQPQRKLTQPIASDDNAGARALWAAFLPLLLEYMSPDTNLFLCQGWSEFDWCVPLVRKYFTIKSKVVWNKNVWGIGYYTRPKHEDILYCWKGEPPTIAEPVADVWDVARSPAPEHAAEKPPELSGKAIRHFCSRGDIVVDWFCGVGGTIIACEQLARQCRAVEISPAYVSVALQRFLDATGCTPHLLE